MKKYNGELVGAVNDVMANEVQVAKRARRVDG